MDLFEYMRENTMKQEAPLASRLRPENLDEVVGQQHIIGKDKLLYRAIKADKLSSIIFYGPPGTGKTTLAKVIAHTTSAYFKQINATVAGKKDMEDVVEEAKNNLGMYGRKTILFVDEIHRFNKGQQDYLLPFVEDGTIILIGATTENPYFEVNSALLSRSIIFELKSLDKEDIKTLLRRAVYDEKKGMGTYHAEIDDDALDFLADVANGDARSALNAIELGILTTARAEDGKIHITLATAQECIQKRVVKYDKSGDNHYDTISAFIKSMRGSDPDAAVYYLARMLYAGEDIKFIARRILICASEDVGNADPQALVVASAAAQAVERLGMPEARITLSQAAVYVACAPKSNAAYLAVDKALSVVKTEKTATIPAHLQDAHYKGAGKLGHGLGYQYAHDFPNHYVKQQYLPDELVGRTFYEPTEIGYEKTIKQHLKRIKAEADSE
jgi:putative ATPase